MNGIHEVVGSIPSSSTKDYKGLAKEAGPFFVFEGCFVTFCDISELIEVVSCSGSKESGQI